MNNKIKIFLLLLVSITIGNVWAEQITTVAIIDIGKVFDSFPNKSYGYESLNNLKEQYQQEIDNLVRQLDVLKKERLNALKSDNYSQVQQLDDKINSMVDYIDSLSKRRQRELIRKSQIPVSKEFLDKLQDAISFVSEEKGYTLVLQNSMDGIQWWAPVIEITDLVIERLEETLQDD